LARCPRCTATGGPLAPSSTRSANGSRRWGARALDEAQRRFEAPLARRSELRGLLEAYRVMANRRGRAEDAELQTEYDRARAILFRAPLDLEQGAAALAAYENAVRKATKNKATKSKTTKGIG
jgi:hypothetical protein